MVNIYDNIRPMNKVIDKIKVKTRHVYCSGEGEAGSAHSHPRVFLEIKGEDVVCPYCSRTFVLKK